MIESFTGNLAGVLSALLYVVAAIVTFCLAELVSPGILPGPLKHVISAFINRLLEWKYPILHKDGLGQIPSCPYVWPNGQGDDDKFIGGIENSTAWQGRNGNVYRIWSGMKSEIVLTQPQQLQQVFKDSDRHSKAPANNSGYYMSQLLGDCLGLISGKSWRSLRAVVETPFSHRAVVQCVDDYRTQVEAFFEGLDQQPRGNLAKGLIHPAEDLKMLPFWIVAKVFYGALSEDLTKRLTKLAPMREKIFGYVIRGGLPRFSWSRFLPTRANKELRQFKQSWKQFNEDALQHAKLDAPSAPIVRMAAAVENGEIDEEQLLQTIDEALFANLDVTTGGLSWNLVFLAVQPKAQERLRKEMRDVEAQGGGGEAALDAYIQDRSTYLAACVLESSRLRPLAAFSVPQAAPTARDVDGFVVPAGTSFVVDAYALNVRGDEWAPDHAAYRPDRFLGGRDTHRRYLFWRFGFGPRQCLGKHMADIMIRATLVHLVRNYDLSLLSDDIWSRNKECWITHPDFLLRCEKRLEEKVQPTAPVEKPGLGARCENA